MSSEWKTVPFGELYAIPSRNGLTKPKRVRGEGYKFINMGEIFAYSRMLNIDCDRAPATEKELESSTLETGDLLFARQSLVLSGAGKCSIFLGDDETTIFESHLIRVRPDAKKVLPEYLYYYFTSPIGRSEIWGITEQGAGQAGIRGSDLETVQVKIPSLAEQSNIVAVLSAIDDKIELNRQINTTLESMAQALFKSWFVDFDPVIDNALAAGNPIPDELSDRTKRRKILRENPTNPHPSLPAEIQQLFPSSFVFTEEMGWVPEGWSVNSIGNMVDRFPVGKKFSQKTASEQGTVPVLDQGKSGVIGYHDEEPGVLASPEDPIIVFANHTCYMRLVMHNFSAIQNVLPFKGKSLDIYWLYFATLGKQPFIEYKGHWPDFVIHNLAIPTNGLDSVFGEQVASQIKSIYVREVQNESLGNLRDTILPKLLSGQLQIPEAEQQLAEVI